MITKRVSGVNVEIDSTKAKQRLNRHVPANAVLLSASPVVLHSVPSKAIVVQASSATVPIAHLLAGGRNLPSHFPLVSLVVELHGSASGRWDLVSVSLNENTPYATVHFRIGSRTLSMLKWGKNTLSFARAIRWYPRVSECGGQLTPKQTHTLRQFVWRLLDNIEE
jgi:hypothetical protein